MSDQTTTGRALRRRRPRVPANRFLTVRMYDVGFGDCFLLLIPKADGKPLKVLFDCGSIKRGASDTPIRTIVQQVIRDITPPGADQKPRIDVLVATHRHKDHIIGFDDPAWAEVEIGEVWMPWTERPDDTSAARVRDLHYRLAEQLKKQLEPAINDATLDAANQALARSGLEMAINALSNDGAVRTLLHGFANDPPRRYFPEEGAATSWFTTPLLPGATVNVLGPSRSLDVITDLIPPAGQTYLKLFETGEGDQPSKPVPFRADWTIAPEDYAQDANSGILFYSLDADDRQGIRNANLGLDGAVATALDQALNGTSLVLALQIGTATLLFPGDAQWGTWRLALTNTEARKLLQATTFYKVGHHGSHNATPLEFVEQLMGANVCALISVNPTEGWPLVPKPELLAAMQARQGCKMARSDEQEQARQAGFTVTADNVIEAKIPF